MNRREVGNELVVDRQIRGEHEEVADALGQVKVGDECPHQARLADAGCQREAERGEVPLEVRDVRKFGVNGGERLRGVLVFAQRKQVTNTVKDLERLALRGAQAQAVGDCVSGRFIPHLPVTSDGKRLGCALAALRRACFGVEARRASAGDCFWWGCGLRQVGDIEAVVVVAPFALGEHCGRNLLDREVREGIGLPAKGSTADEQAAAVANLIAQLRELFACKRLGRDVEEVTFRGAALLPVKLIARGIGEAHDLAHGFGQHRGVVLSC